jgi:hypothetical protein
MLPAKGLYNPIRQVSYKATFLTSTSWDGTNMNPIVLMSRPKNEALGLCVDWYVDAFRRKAPYSYWGWSICGRLADALRKTLGRSVGNDRAELISHGDDLYQKEKIITNKLPL